MTKPRRSGLLFLGGDERCDWGRGVEIGGSDGGNGRGREWRGKVVGGDGGLTGWGGGR